MEFSMEPQERVNGMYIIDSLRERYIRSLEGDAKQNHVLDAWMAVKTARTKIAAEMAANARPRRTLISLRRSQMLYIRVTTVTEGESKRHISKL